MTWQQYFQPNRKRVLTAVRFVSCRNPETAKTLVAQLLNPVNSLHAVRPPAWKTGDDSNALAQKARNCAFYSYESVHAQGLRVIYGPDNTPYQVYCHNDQWNANTLVMSYSRDNVPVFKNKPLYVDHPVSEGSHNWKQYRLPLAVMKALHDVADKWKITCSYHSRGMQHRDSLVVDAKAVDPFFSGGTYCAKVKRVRIKDHGCDDCVVCITQGNNAWHMVPSQQKTCDGHAGYSNVVPSVSCPQEPSVDYIYFGNYRAPPCFDEQFTCTDSGDATTNFWFVQRL